MWGRGTGAGSGIARSRLDAETLMLLRIAALVSVGAPVRTARRPPEAAVAIATALNAEIPLNGVVR